MNLDSFDYHLPQELIAKYPSEYRDKSRLLCLDRKTGEINNHVFKEIIDFIKPNDLVVFNNSRVMHARLYGNKETGAKIELLVEKIFDDANFSCHIKSNRAPKVQSNIVINGFIATVLSKDNSIYTLKLLSGNIYNLMTEFGHVPLPPYIKRDDDNFDKERYQTVYNEKLGSVAAPTAGLHFTCDLMQDITDKGADIAYVTLHVGSGTFKQVMVDNIKDHDMHSETVDVSETVCAKIKKAKSNGGRIIAVGTTSVRCLERAAINGDISPYCGDTNIFLYPGKKFNIVDAIITNFHLPKSTLIMLVSAFAGYDNTFNAYNHAIENKYHFYSYGDAMFIY